MRLWLATAFEDRGLEIRFTRGHRYLGGWLGDAAGKKAWMEDQVGVWVRAVERMGAIARQYLQSAYAGFAFCLQMD